MAGDDDTDADEDIPDSGSAGGYELGSYQYATELGLSEGRFENWMESNGFAKATSFWIEVDLLMIRNYIQEHPDVDISERLLDRTKSQSVLLGSGDLSQYHLLSGSEYRWFDHSSILAYANSRGYTYTSTTGGAHNTGSLHYLGQAIDVRTRGKSDVEKFIKDARSLGLNVRDERTKPPNQVVWSGPHLHIDTHTLRTRPEMLSD